MRRITTRRRQRGGWASCFGGKCATAGVNTGAHGLPPTTRNPLSSVGTVVGEVTNGPVIYGPATVVNPIASIGSAKIGLDGIKQIYKNAKLKISSTTKAVILSGIKLTQSTLTNIFFVINSQCIISLSANLKAGKKINHTKGEGEDLITRLGSRYILLPHYIKSSFIKLVTPFVEEMREGKMQPGYCILEKALEVMDEIEPASASNMPGSPANSGNEGNS